MRTKEKKCKQCGNKFSPRNSFQKTCSVECAIEDGKKESKKVWNKEKKVRLEALMTASEWRNVLQKVFNTYIRERDKGKPCISCDRPVVNGHASHFWSVGSYPNLRFDEMNCHKSCNFCNLHLHGNLIEYALRLPKRIGQEEFDKLNERRNGKLKLTIPEIKELIEVYKQKTKDLK